MPALALLENARSASSFISRQSALPGRCASRSIQLSHQELLAAGGRYAEASDVLVGAVTAHKGRRSRELSTLYHRLGIDVAATTIPDHAGRPQYLLDRREPIAELV